MPIIIIIDQFTIVQLTTIITIARKSVPSIYPAENQYVASNSLENVTFNCSVPVVSQLVWEIAGIQRTTQNDIDHIANLGVLIYTTSEYTTVTITHPARQQFRSLSVQCVSIQDYTKSTKSTSISVATFGRYSKT